jgi:LDH2 family malate/lactate/ureidoglycolate dehydrogenase
VSAVSAAPGGYYSREELARLGSAVFQSTGMSTEDAAILTDSLIDADERGVVTHGLIRLPAYHQQLTAGQVNPCPQVVVVADNAATVLLDGDGGFGAPAGVRAMSMAVERARQFGIGMAGVRRVAHFGAASYYTRLAASAGCFGLAMTNTSAVVAPWGGREPRLGNNPLAFAAPAASGGMPVVLDMAMSAVSRGRIKLAFDRGETLPDGWALDAAGAATTVPAEALTGALQPAGGHKGSGLSIAVELLAAALTGAQLSQDVIHAGFTSSPGHGATGDAGQTADVTVGNLYLAIDANAFGELPSVLTRVRRVSDYVRGCPPMQGFDRVRVPGEVEAQSPAGSQPGLVLLSDETGAALAAAATAADTQLPAPAAPPS